MELSRFQITHPYGVRPSSRCPMWQWCLFQFTHPYGVRPAVAAALNVKYRFNSRTHIGRDAASAYVPLSRSLSFNSRTHMGCDTGAITRLSSSTRFNSRTHMGCDPIRSAIRSLTFVSIHAPIWGATQSAQLYAH